MKQLIAILKNRKSTLIALVDEQFAFIDKVIEQTQQKIDAMQKKGESDQYSINWLAIALLKKWIK